MKYYHEIKELLCDLRFFLESFYFFFNRIARYAQSKESRNLLKKIPQITCKAIFRSCLYFLYNRHPFIVASKFIINASAKKPTNNHPCIASISLNSQMNHTIN